MADKITYYAVSDVNTSRDRPRTVLRRIENVKGRTDQLFSRNLKWEFSPLLHSAERGDTMFDFSEITEGEALRIIDRVRAETSQPE